MNIDLAYLLGVYLSDGSAHRSGRNWVVSLLARDKDFVAETAEVVGRVVGKNVSLYQDRDYWKFSLYSKDLVLYLWDVTSHKEKIPESIMYGSLQVKLAFIAGLLDGDGFVFHNKQGQYQVGFVGTHNWVRDTLPGLLQSLGVRVHRITTRWPKTKFKTNKPIHRVGVNVHSFIAAGGHARMQRKNQRLLDYYEYHQADFSDAEKQRRYKRSKNVSPSETIGFYANG